MIRLHSLTMSNFRGIREGVIDGLADVNILIGRNNSGKTTVVEAIMRLFMNFGGDRDVLGRPFHEIWNAIRHQSQNDPPELWYRQDRSNELLIKAKFGDSNNPDRATDLTNTYRIDRRDAQLDQNVVEGGTTKRQVDEFGTPIGLFRPLDGHNRSIESQFWSQLLADRRDKLLTQSLNGIFDLQAESFQLLPDNRLVVLFNDYSLPLDLQGDGTRAAMRTMIMLAMMSQSLLILEEPECHQHPGSLERFAQVLCKSAISQEVQLLISTHSAECVRAFLKAAKAAPSEAAVFHLDLEEGKQTARRLDAEAVEELENTGVDVRFLDLYA